MIDDFGKIMVFGDYEGDLKAIVDKLNSLRWSFESVGGREWAVEQSSAHESGAYKGSDHKKGRYHKKGRDHKKGKDHKKREIIVLNGDLPDPTLRPVGRFLCLKTGGVALLMMRMRRLLNNGNQIKTTVLSVRTNVRSTSLALLFHRTSTKARLNLWRCSYQEGSFVTSGFSFDPMAAPNGICVRRWTDPLFADHWTRRDMEYYDPLVLGVPGVDRVTPEAVRWLRQVGYDTPALTALAARDGSTKCA